MGSNSKISPKNVLIVEDDVFLAMVVKRLVEKMGHQITATVDNGKDALGEVEEGVPDIILMDVGLKGSWSGIETMQKIRKHSSVPVIYLSGSTERNFREQAEKIGYTNYLQKPVTLEDLRKAFREAFEGNFASSKIS